MAAVDVIVLGVGGMGSAAVYELARRGVRVLGLEQFRCAHDRGSSHGRTRVIRQAYHEGPEYVPLLYRAYARWRALEQEAERPLLTITGALHLGAPESAGVAGAALSARTHGIPHEMLSAEEVRARYPVLRPRPDQVALLEYEAGFLAPEQCVTAYVECASRCGAAIHFGERVTAWHAGRGDVRVETACGSYTAGRLIITAGPWAPQALADLGLPLQVARAVVYWFEPLARRDELRRLPVYLWEDGGIYAYGFPYLDGQGLKCGFHHAFAEPTTPETIRRDVDGEEKRRMQAHLARFMPDAAGAVAAVSTCMYTNTPDFHFVIGRHPAHEQVVLAAGFSGHGFKFASVVGEVLADLALTGTTAQPVRLFDVERFRSPVR
jgi:sarcosine oxidase